MQAEAGRIPARAAAEPSQWVLRWAGAIAAGGEVLDLACGRGRHSLLLARLGFSVCAVDRDAQALAGLAGHASVATLQADLERDAWPLAGRRFQGVVVANYLHRPLFGHILDALSPGGVLVYETFAAGNGRFGKPSNPDFLLRPGELLEVVRGHLRVLAYEDIEVSEPAPAMVQRLCARREASQP